MIEQLNSNISTAPLSKNQRLVSTSLSVQSARFRQRLLRFPITPSRKGRYCPHSQTTSTSLNLSLLCMSLGSISEAYMFVWLCFSSLAAIQFKDGSISSRYLFPCISFRLVRIIQQNIMKFSLITITRWLSPFASHVCLKICDILTRVKTLFIKRCEE